MDVKIGIKPEGQSWFGDRGGEETLADRHRREELKKEKD